MTLPQGFMSNHSVLQIESAAVQFGDVKVLRGIDLQVEQGRCLVLLGPSGCGKTTLLNLISGSVRLNAGTVQMGGSVLDDPAARVFVPMRDRGFAMVFQDFSLWPHMTVSGNVAFGLKVQHIAKAEREARVEDALRKTRMLEMRDRRPSELSGGQQQRVAIARALAVRPKLLLLDEPLSALDAKLREELKAELKLLLRETGQTAVYVTHDQSEAYALGDEVALMREGGIEQCAAPEDIYHRPHSAYVADFLGGANVLSFEQRDGELFVDGLGRMPARPDFPDQGQCYVRRECLWFCNEESPEKSGELTCVVNQFLGTHYLAEIRSGRGVILYGRGAVSLRGGEAVRVEFNPADVGLIPEREGA